MPLDSKVLLKPNMLSVENKESLVVSHYAVFEAVKKGKQFLFYKSGSN